MASINRLKAKLVAADAGPITCVWLSLASEMATELLAGAGFGSVVIDTEHAPNDISQTRLQVCEYPGIAVLLADFCRQRGPYCPLSSVISL
eukprot:4511694-Pleurochrysis_carterae.AAC.6